MQNDLNSTLPRRLGLWSAAAVLIGSTIGSGIFRSPADVADKVPGPLPIIAVWVTAGLFALCGAFTMAEIASAYPRTGGIYVYLREGWGKMPGFLFGWSQIVLVRASALGGIAFVFSEYFLRTFGVDVTAADNALKIQLVAAAAVVVTGSFNYFGIKYGSFVQNLTTLAKFGGLLFIIIFAFAFGLPSTGGHYSPAVPPGSFSIAPFGIALVSALWAYDGWADLSFVGGEVKDPQRTLPRALIIGTLAIIAVYVLANLAYLAVLDAETIRTSPLVAADVAEAVLGAGGVVFVTVTVMVSTFGTLNGTLLTGPRIFFALAEDKLLFQQVAKVHPKYQTPNVAIALSVALGVLYIFALKNFENLANAFVTAMVVFYGMSIAAIFVLRKREDFKPSFRTPLFPVLPILFVLATIFLIGNALLDAEQRMLTAYVLMIILAGIPVYYLIAARKRQQGG